MSPSKAKQQTITSKRYKVARHKIWVCGSAPRGVRFHKPFKIDISVNKK